MLYGECTVNGGAIEQSNFDSYNGGLARFNALEHPKICPNAFPNGVAPHFRSVL